MQAIAASQPEWLTTIEAAARLGVAKNTLEQMRVAGTGPVFSKVGRLVRYHPSDLDDFMRGNRRMSTSEGQ